MDTDTLLCVVEILGTLIVAAAAVVIRNGASIRQSLGAIGETTRATRSQWASISAGVLGANLGYFILVGTYSLAMWLDNPTDAKAFWVPAAAVAYLLCAVPAYLPVGAVSGLLIYRFAQRKALGTRAGFIIALAASTFLGAVVAIPIYLVGLMGAAL